MKRRCLWIAGRVYHSGRALARTRVPAMTGKVMIGAIPRTALRLRGNDKLFFPQLRRDASGATAVENAIVLPIFFLFLFVVFEAGLFCWAQTSLQFSVEAAARCAAVNSTLCGTNTSVQSYAASQMWGMSVPTSDFTVSQPSCGHEVTASYPFSFAVPLVHKAAITLTAQSCHP